jgi:diaminohydroxyphosphoribosylaminopyrimidine deaminase/5-amino-6-(5-phosphoribosylamino)uracil reductase
MLHSKYLNLAIDEAWKYQGLTYPNPSVGAVIVKQDKIIAIQAHKKAGEPHAEVLACKEAYYNITKNSDILALNSSKAIHEFLYTYHDDLFSGCTIYTTLEPCNHIGKTPPCSLLLKNLKFKKVVIGSKDTNEIAKDGAKSLNNVEFVKMDRCDELLLPFKKWSESRFVFFKWAWSKNHVIDGGYISCDESLDMVHSLRDRCDLLVIGGNSVRVDRPTLDSKRVGGKAPDVLIYSKQKEFDQDIPLFGVANRKVMISDSLNILDRYNFILIEGVGKMFELTQDIVDYYLIFTSPDSKKGTIMKPTKELDILYSSKVGRDDMVWAKSFL